MGARVIVIKCGTAGAYLRTAGTTALSRCGRALEPLAETWSNIEMFHPSFHIPRIVNTTGAGDVFVAGLLCGVIRRERPIDALSVGRAAGAVSTQSVGACGTLEPYEMIRSRVQSGWRVNAPASVPDDWELGPRSTLVSSSNATR